jgi:hypothetical protein
VGLPTLAVERSRYESKETVMNRIRHIRRITAALAGLACAWVGIAIAAPAAFADVGRVQPPGGGPAGRAVLPAPLAAHIHQPAPQAPGQVPVHTVLVGGMPGWQIALIAIGAALFAATAAVLLDRARTTRRHPATAGA